MPLKHAIPVRIRAPQLPNSVPQFRNFLSESDVKLCDMGRGPRFTEEAAREAIAESKSWTEALRRLDYCPTGGNPATLKKYAALWGISTDHFDPYAGVMEAMRRPRRPLGEILVEHSTFSRSNLKQRLYEAGLKQPRCEMCGQGETWRGRHMSMILERRAQVGSLVRAAARTGSDRTGECGGCGLIPSAGRLRVASWRRAQRGWIRRLARGCGAPGRS